ncbi:MAG TPA: DUF4339 domain-containing protein [Polyangiaceae bacterium]
MKKPIAPTPLRTPLPPRSSAADPITLPSTPVAMPSANVPMMPPPLLAAPLWRDWYVYQGDGRHIGPLSTDTLARAWLAGKVPQDSYIGAAGDTRWWPLGAVPEIMDAVRAIHESGQNVGPQSMSTIPPGPPPSYVR